MLLLYNIAIRGYWLLVLMASPWNKKASAWREGRKRLFEQLEQTIKRGDKIVWMHCSSAGEFEQGKPLIESLKKNYSGYKILVSFFSPSGYSVAPPYPHADYITFLPLDTRRHAERFVKAIDPQLVIFVKYEFWYHHLHSVAFRHIPLLLISASFRSNQVFFKSSGRFFREMLRLFTQLFVQDQGSASLLQNIGITNVSVAGDSRFDRVATVGSEAKTIPFIEPFISGRRCIVAGSTWPDDEKMWSVVMSTLNSADSVLIIAPHEVNESHLKSVKDLFPEAVYASELKAGKATNTSPKIIIIDSTGLLSQLYQHAVITYVGGGFTKDGVHNVLEPAVWGKPVLFGPNYQKYREAVELVKEEGGYSIRTSQELLSVVNRLLSDKGLRNNVGKKAGSYVQSNTGATEKMLWYIQENRLLTN